LGASLVFAIAWLIPKVGAGPVMITLLAGNPATKRIRMVAGEGFEPSTFGL
jgi:hypothetical protein